jgi:hypothetical protein
MTTLRFTRAPTWHNSTQRAAAAEWIRVMRAMARRHGGSVVSVSKRGSTIIVVADEGLRRLLTGQAHVSGLEVS